MIVCLKKLCNISSSKFWNWYDCSWLVPSAQFDDNFIAQVDVRSLPDFEGTSIAQVVRDVPELFFKLLMMKNITPACGQEAKRLRELI